MFLYFYSCSSNDATTERLNPETDKLGMSYSKFKRKDLSKLGELIMKVSL